MTVPASWPVYRLALDPSRCVLFNRHAVYLGNPGANQNCPVRAVGKTEALLIQPLTSASRASLAPQMSVQRGTNVNLPSGRQAAQDAVSQMIRLALPTAGVQVTASYGHDLSLIRSILRGAHLTSESRAAVRQAAEAGAAPGSVSHAAVSDPAVSHPAARHAPARSGSSRDAQARHHTRRGSRHAGRHRHGRAHHRAAGPARPAMAAAASSSSTLSDRTGSGLGFDTCTVPSVTTMKAWLDSPFRAVGTYLGGDNWACSYGNFNRSWVSHVAGMGWRFIPLWVGPQAPCTPIGGAVRINTSEPVTQGRSQAASAVSTASSFGYGKGSPIYFDMEGYDNLDSSCSHAVLSFLSGWTQGLHKAGYRSGVYSSASSGIADLAGQYHRSGYTEPDDIWYGKWDADPVVNNGGVGSDWPGYRRVHQFDGPNVERFGGVGVNIDDDFVAGDVAGLRTLPGAYVLSRPDAVRVSPGSTGQTSLVITEPKDQKASQTVRWHIRHARGVTIRPDQGTTVATPGESVTIGVRIKVSSSAWVGRDDLTVTASSGSQALSGTRLMISVAPGRDRLSAPVPIKLYAADHSSILEAERVAREMALPLHTVTGNFQNAWRDISTGKSIVVALGEDALTALYRNPCGWDNPAHRGKGSTPFTDLGGPLNHPPGKIYFENAAGASPAQTAELTDALTKYALTRRLASPHALPSSPNMPGNGCHGVPRTP